MNQRNVIEIGLVVYEKAQMAAVLGLTDLFVIASETAATLQNTTVLPLQVSHWELKGSELLPSRTFSSNPDTSEKLAAVIIPPPLKAPIEQQAATPWVEWLRAQHSEGVILSSVCAGAMAWTDLGLRMVDRFLGSKVMNETARALLIDPSRREQCYYSAFSPVLTHGDAVILKVQHWLQRTDAQDINLATLASHAELEERTFLRRFHRATGMTSTEYCQRLRIGEAKDFLQFSLSPVEQIAWKVGYSDVSAFRKIFKRIVGLTPSRYRQRFNTNRE